MKQKPSEFKPVEIDRLGLRKLRSPAARRVLAGLKAAADANGLPVEGRFVEYRDKPGCNAIVLGVSAGHSGERDYQAAFPAIPEKE